VFILTERTPNPEAMKFLPDTRLTDGAAWSFERENFDPLASPLAARLFAVEGVRRIFITPDFLTVSRETVGPTWEDLRYAVIAAIADHLESGAVAVAATAAPPDAEDEIEAEIRQVLGLYVRPGVARDGGEVLFERFDPACGVLWVRMEGACGGCPSARMTLKSSVERIVRRYVPEVLRVEEVMAAPAEPAGSRVKRWLSGLKDHTVGSRPRTIFTRGGMPIGKDQVPPDQAA
jgi:NFU1 iron-sulfur cluster scaffold homolog, mitochondrial